MGDSLRVVRINRAMRKTQATFFGQKGGNFTKPSSSDRLLGHLLYKMGSRSSARRYANESELRTLPLLEKAARVSLRPGVSTRDAAEEFGVSRSSIQRALAARSSGRSIGVKGRPPKLSKLECQVLLELIRDAGRRRDPPSTPELCEMVSSLR